jgi:hypothetical protein
MNRYEGLKPYYQEGNTLVYKTNNFKCLSDKVQQDLGSELVAVAAAGFARPITPEFDIDVRNHLADGHLMVVTEANRSIAFAVRKSYPEFDAVYLAGSVKIPSSCSGIVETVTAKYVQESGLGTVVTRTQNDRVIEMMQSICKLVIPLDRSAYRQDREKLKELGLLTSNVDPETLIVRGHYGGPMILTNGRRRSEDPEVRRLTDQLDYEAGDAQLLVGYRRVSVSLIDGSIEGITYSLKG